jgi:GLPGLI family protein
MVWLQSGLYEDNYVSAFGYMIYKNHYNGIITYTDHNMSAGHILYEENKQAFDWEITTETDSINGFLSQKAMCNYGGRRWEAWFTPDIQYSDGPYKFCGLPGLILKIADTQGHYSFNVLELELPKHGTMVEFRDLDYIKTTRKEFNKMMDDYNKDIINILKGMGINASSAQQASQYVASQNNPLELDRK